MKKLDKQLQKLDIYEYDDLESQRLYDAVKEKITQALRAYYIDRDKLDPTTFTKNDLGIKATAEIYQAPDGAIGSEEIQREIDRVGKRANKFSQKESKAIEFIKACCSAGFYGLLRLRKWLGIPWESFTVRTWYAGYLPVIPLLVNPGGEIKLREGTYNLYNNLDIGANICISGTGFSAILKQANVANIGQGGGRLIKLYSGNNILSHVQIDFNGLNQTYSGNPVNTWTHAIQVGETISSPFTRIYDVKIINAFGREKDSNLTVDCIDLFNCPYTILQNIICDVFDAGIVLTREYPSTITRYVLSKIILLNSKNTSNSLYLEEGDSNILDNVQIYNSSGIYIPNHTNFILSNTVIKNSLDYGISLGVIGATNGSLNNIKVLSPSSYGLSIANVDNCLLENIYVSSSGNHGINISSGSATLTNCVVYGSSLFGFNFEGSTVDVNLVNCKSMYSQQYGVVIQSGAKASLIGCISMNNSQSVANTYSGVYMNTTYNTIIGGKYYDDQTTPTQKYGIFEDTGADNNIITYISNLSGNISGMINKVGDNTIVLNNVGYNPVGYFGGVSPSPSNPSVPTSGTAYTNSYGYPCLVSVYGGTVTDIALDGVSTGQTSGTFTVPPGGTITLTYSAAPSWKWYGL